MSVSRSLAVLLLLSLLQLVPSQSEVKVYKKDGDEVVLSPGPASSTVPITNILWKVGPNKAVQWASDELTVTYYRHFKERGHLNISSGALTITGLTKADSAVYTLEINDQKATSTRLIVISPVPVPSIYLSCDDERTSCILTCEGNTTGSEPVTYKWKSGESEWVVSSKENRIEKEDSVSTEEFRCEMENEVSRQISDAIRNPFAESTKGELNINVGLTVCICLLSVVVLCALIHRVKAGMWFFQKASMPWEADFWRKSADECDTNGATEVPEKGQEDEGSASQVY